MFAEYDGWEDPVYFARNDDERQPRYAFERGNWFDVVGEEARAVRDAVGLFDFSTFAKYMITGPGAAAWLDTMFANRLPTTDGKSALMPMLSPKGRVNGDFTLTRLANDRFLMLGGGAMQRIHMRWFQDHLPDSGVEIANISSEYGGLHIAGPKARSLLETITSDDVGNEAFPFLSCRKLQLAGNIEAYVVRVSFTGELGYEIYCPARQLPAVYDALVSSGDDFGLRLVGSHALMSLRLEKSFPSWGLDLASDYYPDESGLGRFIAADKGDFIGKDALLTQRQQGPREQIAIFAIDVADADAYSGEPIYCNGELAGYVTSGGYGYRVDQSLALGYLSPNFTIRIRNSKSKYSVRCARPRCPIDRCTTRPARG